jgi:uncharacterized membrane protein YgaE (UPF0421/DUF939 family)
MSAAAALIAYLPARALGLQQSFWGAITAIAVVQTEFGATRTSARDQFTGAAIGGLIGVAIVSLIGQEVISYTAAVIVSITACWMLNVTSAARLAGVTTTIIMRPAPRSECLRGPAPAPPERCSPPPPAPEAGGP